ncbi:hypothetical protein P3T76_009080 [Phytophthora citrophthora]|uniref:Uncharacterized protein n=1 Tax=Phytophthora citrophthora TaxID=4793 RepID=A0AAD9LJP5_9STRA|nr:hypothetical protein P3T76_009080 [Phytophthora citrophthora]
MYELLLSACEHYIRLELLPVYLTIMVLWALTSSVRGVVGSLVTQAWMVVSVNSSLVVNFVTRYQDVLRDPELNQLAGPSYAFALWNAFIAVPVQVIEEGEAEYGQYGVMLRSWWTALLVTCGDYLPDLSMRSGYSYLAYSRASWEAWTTVCQRVVAIVKGFCWFVLLVLSLVIHVPMMLFDLLEFVALGTTGLAAVLVMTNSLNQMFEWTRWLTTATGVIVAVGNMTHGGDLANEVVIWGMLLLASW